MTNLLAFAAILDSTWILLLDEKSHNSMYIGAYLSNVYKVVKFRHNDMIGGGRYVSGTGVTFKLTLVLAIWLVHTFCNGD